MTMKLFQRLYQNRIDSHLRDVESSELGVLRGAVHQSQRRHIGQTKRFDENGLGVHQTGLKRVNFLIKIIEF
jgi:hypothetical protein